MSYSPDDGLARLLYQYRHSTKMRALIRSLLEEYELFCEVAGHLRTRLDIGLSVGAQLDGIGEIVGRPRPRTVQIAPEDAFAFDVGPGAGFSSLSEPTTGGQFVGVNGLLVGDMPDEQYRVLLRATIFANYARSTPGNLEFYGEFVLAAPVSVTERIGVVDLSVAKPLQVWEIDIIRNTFPTAAGVRLGLITFSDGPFPFGFAGDRRNAGFSSVDGGTWDDAETWDGSYIRDDTSPWGFGNLDGGLVGIA